jgi:uncharacterized protein YkwD
MYQFKLFARLTFLLVISAIFVTAAYALGAEGTSAKITSSSTNTNDLNQKRNKPKAAIAKNPPKSQMRDLNADGILDFITTQSKRGGVSIALGLGNGKFEQRMNYLTGRKPLTVRIRDFNNDNTLDLAAYNFKHKRISILFGDGNGSFTEQKAYRMNPAIVTIQPGQNNPTPSSDASAAMGAPNAAAAPVTGIAALEQSVHQKINAYRASRTLPALALNATISNVARSHSQNMVSGSVPFGHQGFDARVQTLSRTFTFRSVGENVAYNQGYSDPAAVAVNGWLRSPEHLNNIVGSFNLTGIGVARNSKGEYFFTQIFWRQ